MSTWALIPTCNGNFKRQRQRTNGRSESQTARNGWPSMRDSFGRGSRRLSERGARGHFDFSPSTAASSRPRSSARSLSPFTLPPFTQNSRNAYSELMTTQLPSDESSLTCENLGHAVPPYRVFITTSVLSSDLLCHNNHTTRVPAEPESAKRSTHTVTVHSPIEIFYWKITSPAARPYLTQLRDS